MPDAPPPDFQKAYSLYTKALALELPRGFRDGIFFQKARAIQQAGNAAQAIQDFQAYLTEYDPAWVGPAGSGSARLPVQNPPPAGAHVAMARFRLAEAFHQSGNAEAARMELTDLLKMISAPMDKSTPLALELASEPGKSLAAEIRWLTVQTYFAPRPMPVINTNAISMPVFQQGAPTDIRIGNTGGLPSHDVLLFALAGGEPDQALKACRDYLADHPAGSRATRVAWMMAEALQSAGRADDAIAAYRDFIAGKGFRLPDGAAADTYDEEIRATPATHLANLKMRALYRVGRILADQKKHEEAIATWQSYVKEYPNGPEWSDCQNAIINSEFQLGLDALTDKREDIAMRRFDDFLRSHPLDPRAPRILYLFGAIHEAKALDMEDAKDTKDAIAASYRKAIDEWTKLVSKYPDSPEATAAMLKSGVLLEEKLGEHEKALKLYQKLANERGDVQAQAAISRLTGKQLALSADRVFRTNEKPVVRLKLRNIDECEVRVYRIDLQAYFRKMHGITGVEALDTSLIQPDKSWTLKPDGYAKYKPLEQDVEIPFDGNTAGACVVSVADDDWESSVLVLRSDLEVIVKSSRREVLAFVQDMLTGEPAAGVDLLVSNGTSVAATGKTGTDGVFKTSLDALENLADVRVFALRSGHACAFNLPLAGLQRATGLTPKGYLYTDRPAYLPGEKVSMRGVLRDVKDGGYAIPANAAFLLRFADPQGRLMAEQSVSLTRFGTFDAVFQLPASAPTGPYTMTASQEREGMEPLVFQGNFEVRAFTLEKIKLSMDFPRRVFFRGEKIEASLQAAYYWGEPVANRVLLCTLPDRRIERVTTDAKGMATLSFDTTGMTPGSILDITATLDGENVTVKESLTLARLGFTISAKPSQPVIIAGEPVGLMLETTGADGKPAGESLKVAVLRKETTRTPRILSLLPWPQADVPPAAEVKVQELDARTDPATGKANLALMLDKGGDYVLRVSGTDRFGQPVGTETSIAVSGDEDANKLRLFADSAILKVGEEAKVRLHSRLDKGLALVTWEGETILQHKVIALHREYNNLFFTAEHAQFPNFRLAVAAIDGRDLRSTAKEFTVERELKVTLKPLKDAFLPGEAGQVEISVTDQLGKPVEAELSLAMVNEALFAVCPDTTTSILEFFQKEARRHSGFHTGATCGFSYAGVTRAVAKALTDEKNRVTRAKEEAEAMASVRDDMAQSLVLPQASAPAVGMGAGGMAGRDGDFRGPRGSTESEALAEKPQSAAAPEERGQAKMKEAGAADMAAAAPRREVRGEGRWLPGIVTGADGMAVATITMPETTTAWRLTARGCTVDTVVGQATAATLTRKDFFVALKAPSFLREGDDIRVTGRVHNLTDFSGTVPMTMRILDAKDKSKVLASREKSAAVPAKGSVEVTFDAFTIPNLPDIIIGLSADTGKLADAVEIVIPVQPWGLPYAVHAGGSANADTAAVLALPASRTYSSTGLAVSVGPGIRTAVLEMAMQDDTSPYDMARLVMPPWGGHPAHDLLAVASALAYANMGQTDQDYTARLAARARALVSSLIAMQAEDGSWSGEVIGGHMTSRAFWALTTASDAGIAVHKETLDKAAAFLLKQLESFDANDNDNKAIALHALSTDKRADFAACNRLYRDRNTLGTTTLAYLVRAFHNIDRKEIALELAGILEGKAKAEPDQPVIWEAGYKTAWLNDPTEATALVLLALAESKPDSPRAADAAQALLQSRGCAGFTSGRARGPAVAALATWFGRGKEQATDMEIGVFVNGKDCGTVKFTPSSTGTRDTTGVSKSNGPPSTTLVNIPADALAKEKNVVEFKMRGRGQYTWAATLTGFSSDMKPTGHSVNPGIDIWQQLHSPLEYRGRPIPVDSSSPVKNLEHGQRVHMRAIDQHGHYPGRWYILEIPLPAGARLVDGSLSADDKSRCEVLPSHDPRVFHLPLPGRVL